MIAVQSFRHPEFRRKVTETILEMLALLPEPQRDIFIWSHYRGHSVKQIAEMLGWSSPKVEATLEGINLILSQGFAA